MEKIKQKIYEALGKASMCWSETPSGVFQDTEVTKIAEELTNDIHEHYNPVKAVTDQIKNDPALFVAWRDNIAMAFKDTIKYNSAIGSQPVTVLDPELVHNLANKAATNFLNLLCEIKPETIGDISHIPGE